jgi:hypothetical protein
MATTNPTRSSIAYEKSGLKWVDGMHQEAVWMVHFFPDSTTVEEVKISNLRHDGQPSPHSVIDAVEDGVRAGRS